MPREQHAVLVDSHNNQAELFAKWIYKESRGGERVVGRPAILAQISHLKDDHVYNKDIAPMISRCREYLETKMNCFLIWMPNAEGYKIAIGTERPRFAGRVCHVAVKHMDRAMRALTVLTQKEMEEAYEDFLIRFKKQLSGSSTFRAKFSDQWLTFIEEKRKEKRDEQKLLDKK